MNRRKTIALLVVLALCLGALAGAAGAGVQVSLADSDGELTGVLHKDSGGGFNGDDDRWGNTSPVAGDPDEPDPDEGVAGGGGDHGLERAQTGTPDLGTGIRIFVNIMTVMFFAR
ncbi:MAG: hypothetical protein GF405_00450 [Candidatus Eisenbacteria bacterium]|nr:hypothetical protein [Candidatus Eisenbacteria bacterium]